MVDSSTQSVITSFPFFSYLHQVVYDLHFFDIFRRSGTAEPHQLQQAVLYTIDVLLNFIFLDRTEDGRIMIYYTEGIVKLCYRSGTKGRKERRRRSKSLKSCVADSAISESATHQCSLEHEQSLLCMRTNPCCCGLLLTEYEWLQGFSCLILSCLAFNIPDVVTRSFFPSPYKKSENFTNLKSFSLILLALNFFSRNFQLPSEKRNFDID